LPGDVDRWWRARNQMRIVNTDGEWQIVGPESQRARIAYANLEGDRLVYSVNEAPASRPDPLSSSSRNSVREDTATLRVPVVNAPQEGADVLTNILRAVRPRQRK
jgi:hypothetical protein